MTEPDIAAGEVGARTGQRLMLTRGPNRLIGRVSSDSVTWITVRLDTGCSLAVDLDGWTVAPEPVDSRPPWMRTTHRWFAWLNSPLSEPLPWKRASTVPDHLPDNDESRGHESDS